MSLYISPLFKIRHCMKYKDYMKLDLGKGASKIKEAYSLNEDSKVYIEHMKRYIGKHMSNYGFEKEIVIVEDEDKYICVTLYNET